MAEGQEDKEQKTEDATQHRIDEAQKKGQVVVSRELNHFFVLLVLTILIGMVFPSLMQKGAGQLAPFLTRPDDMEVSYGTIRPLMTQVAGIIGGLLLVPMALMLFLGVGVALLQGKFIFAVDRITPKWEKVSPVKGLGRMLSFRSVIEFIKGIAKLSVVAGIAYMTVRKDLHQLEAVPSFEMGETLALLSSMALRIMVAVCSVMFFIAILDYVYQRFEFYKNLRMTRQEIRDEHKQQEGDPHIKSKLRAIRMERARKRMMAAVPKADVVITNPTHFAVALTYDNEAMGAPVLVAKGADLVAFRIREVAKENNVPIVENPPLARALHENVELDEEIPYEHYQAVAEVISYIYQLRGKKPR